MLLRDPFIYLLEERCQHIQSVAGLLYFIFEPGIFHRCRFHNRIVWMPRSRFWVRLFTLPVSGHHYASLVYVPSTRYNHPTTPAITVLQTTGPLTVILTWNLLPPQKKKRRKEKQNIGNIVKLKPMLMKLSLSLIASTSDHINSNWLLNNLINFPRNWIFLSDSCLPLMVLLLF